MLKTLTTVAVLVCAAMLPGCAAETASTDAAAQGAEAGPADGAEAFEVRSGNGAGAEGAIPAIVAAGRAQLIAACDDAPEMTVRIFNPLASGDHADIACSDILGGEAFGQTSEAPSSLEHVGQVQQKFGPISAAACLLGPATVFAGTRYGVCPYGKTKQVRTGCNDVGGWGSIGMSVLCFVIIPF